MINIRILKTLPILTSSLVLILFLAANNANSESITIEDTLVRQQWNNESSFFLNWTESKTITDDSVVKGLVSSHVKDTSSGPSLTEYPSKTLARIEINQLWIARATSAIYNFQLENAEFYLTQLSPPLSQAESQWVNSLKTSIEIYKNNFLNAQALFNNNQFNTRFANLIRLQLAQAMVKDFKVDQAQALVSSIENADKGNSLIQTEIARIGQQVDLISGKRELEYLESKVPFGSQNRDSFIKDSYLSLKENGSNGSKIKLLFELTRNTQNGPLSPEQVDLILLLKQEGATFQIIELGNRYSNQLISARSSAVARQSKLLDESLYQRLIRQSEINKDPALLKGLGPESRWFVEEIIRINTLFNLMDKNFEHLESYLKLLEQGTEAVAEELKIFPEVLSSENTDLPEHLINLGPEVMLFERLLSSFIGTPDNWNDRYEYLDGLAQWHTGKPFRNPWWNDNSASIRKATIELRRLMAKRKKLIEELSAQRWSETTKYIRDLKQRAEISLEKLQDSKNSLSIRLKETLEKDGSAPVLQIEKDMLWLAVEVMPNANQFDQVSPQPQFQISSNSAGQVKLNKQSRVVTFPSTDYLFQALKLISTDSDSGNIRRDARMHTASLAAEIAEIKSFSLDPAIQAIPIEIDDAVTLLTSLVGETTDQETLIQGYYQLARAYEFGNNSAQTIVQLENIEKLGIAYTLRDEVLFRLGEAQFESGDYFAAAENYETLASDFPQSIFIDNANYMLGWSYFKQGEYQVALNHFFGLVDRYWVAQNAGEDLEPRLIADTQRVIGMTFANLDGAKSVRKFFEKLGDKPYAENIYADLGVYYEDKLRYTDAAETFEAMTAIYPDSEQAPYYQSRIIKAYTDGNFPSKAWPAKKQFVDSYGSKSLRWQTATPEQQVTIMQFLPVYLVDLAKRDHGKAQNSKVPAGYQNAIDYYDQYIEVVKDRSGLPDIYFLKGEALTELKRYEEAAEAYSIAGYQFEGYERADEAGYAELISYQKLYNQASGIDKLKWLEISIQKSEAFVLHFDSPKYRPLVQTKLAEDMLLREDNQKALVFAEGLLAQKDTEFSPQMRLRLWRVAAHSSFALSQYEKSEQGYLNAIELAEDTVELEVLKKRLVESIYRQAEVAQSEERYQDAVTHFLRVGAEYPESEIRANAEFDAATVLIIMEDWSQALSVLQRFNSLYPNHELQGLLLEKLVVVYENLEDWANASQTLSKIYQREGKSALGRNALWRSASLQYKAGQRTKALTIFKEYVNTFPLPLEPASEARNELHKIYVELKNVKSSEYWLNQNILMHDKYKSEQTDRTQYLASEAGLIMGRKDFEAFSEIKLTLPMEKSLGKKQGLMEQTIAHLNKTMDYSIAEHSTEATALMGDLYAQLASSLMDSERPSDLNPLELEQYELLLEEQVYPFEDQALELYEINVGWIREGIYTSWIEYSLDQLRSILPARYNKPEEVPLYAETIQ